MRPEGRAPAAAAAAFACAMLLSGAAAIAAPMTPQQQVETRLMCYCGCSDLTVRTCSCGTAAAIKSDIEARLAAGQTPDQVVEAYVREHGEQIRSAPGASGFDLLAWVTPFAAILAGGGMIVILTRRWRARAIALAPAAGAPGTPAIDVTKLSADERKTLQRIEREIREDL